MTEWVPSRNDMSWLLWEEQLAPKAWLVCFKPSAPWCNEYWVNVLDGQWSKKINKVFIGKELFAHHGEDALKELFAHHGEDALMQLCLMEEMRKRFGEPPWVQSSQS